MPAALPPPAASAPGPAPLHQARICGPGERGRPVRSRLGKGWGRAAWPLGRSHMLRPQKSPGEGGPGSARLDAPALGPVPQRGSGTGLDRSVSVRLRGLRGWRGRRRKQQVRGGPGAGNLIGPSKVAINDLAATHLPRAPLQLGKPPTRPLCAPRWGRAGSGAGGARAAHGPGRGGELRLGQAVLGATPRATRALGGETGERAAGPGSAGQEDPSFPAGPARSPYVRPGPLRAAAGPGAAPRRTQRCLPGTRVAPRPALPARLGLSGGLRGPRPRAAQRGGWAGMSARPCGTGPAPPGPANTRGQGPPLPLGAVLSAGCLGGWRCALRSCCATTLSCCTRTCVHMCA